MKKLYDLMAISLGNLRRMKLRTFLTTSGVVIAIGTFVAMLSFGAGMQENIQGEFEKLGLFNTMIVYQAEIDSTISEPKQLTDETIAELQQIPGVLLAYPYETFELFMKVDDSEYSVKAQVLPQSALNTKFYSEFKAGEKISSDSAKEVLLTSYFLRKFDIDDSIALVGKEVELYGKVSVLDSGLVKLVKSDDFNIRDKVEELHFDSLFEAEYRSRVLKSEINSALNRFVDGYMNSKDIVSDTLTISGILKLDHRGRNRTREVIIPRVTAERFASRGAGQNPLDIFSTLQAGRVDLFNDEVDTTKKNYDRITLDIASDVLHKNVGDSVRVLGYKPFSYAEQFDEIRKFFFYFNMVLGIVGLIALVTASLGIINTMVMSIMERRKEIGVLKSLGADEIYIRGLFLMESALIGAMGAIGGIILGWLISRIASIITQEFMKREGVDTIELFAVPLWLIGIAFVIGVIVSILAGYFPSSRAAKVDPVAALRNE